VRAVTLGPGEALAVREHPDPIPGTGEVLVAIRAAGVNFADLAQRSGEYPAPPGSSPDIPGLEIAGEVISLGPGAQRFSVGDRVMGLVGGGGQAELVAVHERQLMPVPSRLTWEHAGGFPEAFITSHNALLTLAGLRPGDRSLITGAAGGVGTAGVQIAAAAGAEVIAAVRDAKNFAAVESLGATKVIHDEEIDQNGPYDAVLELVGASTFPAAMRAIRPGGRIVVIGTSSGDQVDFDLALLAEKRATVRASTLRARPLEAKAEVTRAVEREVLPFVERGEVVVPLAATHSLDDAATAYDSFVGRGKLGKVVLVP
jgi:NADPH:quinone reductase